MAVQDYLHWGTFVIAAASAVVSAVIGVATAWAIFYSRMTNMAKSIKDNEKKIAENKKEFGDEIDEVHTLIEGFHGEIAGKCRTI